MIDSINNIGKEGMVTITMSEENAIKMLHFANFGENTLNAVYEVYKGNKLDLDLKMDNLEDLKEQLGVSRLKVSNLVSV